MSEEIIEKLKQLKNDQVQEFSLKNMEFLCKIIDVYDGDTCKMIIYIDNKFVKFHCRLLGIDTPEIKPLKSKENREDEIMRAKLCRNRLISLCCNDNREKITDSNYKEVLENNNNLVKVKCYEFDKYGRVLIELLTHDGESFNNILVKEGLAKEYDGGKKL
jgi:endonuclease YncB( thermonuclease family)